jgi:hypothetical protein
MLGLIFELYEFVKKDFRILKTKFYRKIIERQKFIADPIKTSLLPFNFNPSTSFASKNTSSKLIVTHIFVYTSFVTIETATSSSVRGGVLFVKME